MEDFHAFVSWAFQALVAGGVLYAANAIAKTRESIETLNKSIATVIERVTWQGKEIEKHDGRLTNLEVPKRNRRNKGE